MPISVPQYLVSKALKSKIAKSKVVLVTGAGASAPLDLRLMASFMDLVEERVKQYHEMLEMLQSIYSSYTLPDGSPGRDLETVLDVINRCKSAFTLFEKEPVLKSITPTADDWSRVRETFSELDKAIHDLILKHYSFNSYREIGKVQAKVVELYAPLFQMLTQRFHQTFIPVFTTNYDPAVEIYCTATHTPLEFGFDPILLRWEPERFSQYVPPDEDLAIVLFKLHGSVTWYEREGGGIYYFPIGSSSIPEHQNVIIYPGQTKYAILDPPFNIGYSYLAACLQKAEYVIVVGYSFRDLGFQDILLNAKSANPGLKLVIVNRGFNKQQREAILQSYGPNFQHVSWYFEPGRFHYEDSLWKALDGLVHVDLLPVAAHEDKVGPGPGLITPDGHPDRRFILEMFPRRERVGIVAIDLRRVDRKGKPLDGFWTTRSSESAWPIAVEKPLTEARLTVNEKSPLWLEPFSEGRDTISIYVSDTVPPRSWFDAGQHYKVTVNLTNGESITARCTLR